MSRPPTYARKTDDNHTLVRDGLRGAGFDVLDLSGAGCGVPDLLVRVGVGVSIFIEVKRPDIKKKEQEMTPAQQEWWRFNHFNTRIVQSAEEAVEEVTWAKARWTALCLGAMK